MLREDIRGTNRIVIKNKDGHKFVINKALVNDDELLYIVNFPENYSIPITDRDNSKKVLCNLDNEHFLSVLGSLHIFKDKVLLNVQANSNVSITDSLYDEEDYNPNDIVSFINATVAEPEEEAKLYKIIITVDSPMEIIADPKFMIELLNDGVVVAEEDVLKEYGLLPSWKVYGREGKVKTKKYVDLGALRGKK